MEMHEIFEKLESAQIKTGYIGKGMGGVETIALVVESKEDVIFELLEVIEREALRRSSQSYKFHDAIDGIKEILQSSQDSFGKNKIILY